MHLEKSLKYSDKKLEKYPVNSQFDFEKQWQNKLATSIDDHAGKSIREFVMGDQSENCDPQEQDEVIHWTNRALHRLAQSVKSKSVKDIMLGCACQYPADQLLELRGLFAQTKNIKLVHEKLQERFETFLRNSVNLASEHIEFILENNWGLAGILQGNSIIATKIPKSGNLQAFFSESDPRRRRELYCHCPRLQGQWKEADPVPKAYCYCGAGFYKGIWEYILNQEVNMEVEETVLSGGDVCRFKIELPPGIKESMKSNMDLL